MCSLPSGKEMSWKNQDQAVGRRMVSVGVAGWLQAPAPVLVATPTQRGGWDLSYQVRRICDEVWTAFGTWKVGSQEAVCTVNKTGVGRRGRLTTLPDPPTSAVALRA